MTHPSPAPDPSPPPGGPPRGHAEPLSFAQREEHYRAQNGRRPLTPAQTRRLRKKSRHALAPFPDPARTSPKDQR